MRMDPKSMAVKAAVYFSLLLVTIILVAILVPNMGPKAVEGLPEESGLILQPLSGNAVESVPAELAPETTAPMNADVPAEQEGVHQ